MNTQLILLAVFMFLVTYPSRALGLLAPAMDRLPGRALDYLQLVGPAILAALATESSPPDENERWWVWKCPTKGCPGLLHVAGYALDKHALFVVCDGTCGKTFLR